MKSFASVVPVLLVVVFACAVFDSTARAHCDTMSGPVVTAAKHAIETGNVNLALVWVQPKDESLIREEFEKALAAGKKGTEAEEKAEMHFFEELVRIHRAGEGAPYTGIKPAGADIGVAVPAADHALETGSADDLQKLVTEAIHQGIQKHYQEVLDRRNYDPNDVAAGRAYVKAYVEYTHYVEAVYEAAKAAGHHEHGEAGANEKEHGSAHQGHDAH